MSTISQSFAFLYMAVRPGGGRKFGVRQAGSIPALAASLRQENQLLLKTWRLPGWAAQEGTKELSLKDQATLNEQLAQLLSRGVALVEALEVTAETVRPATRPKVRRMRDLVAAGSSFADACRTVGGFDNVSIAVYRGAERTGDLAGAAKELMITARRRLAVGSKATTLMIYPAIVLSISLIVALIMLIGIVPRLGQALQDMDDVKLPFFSRMVFGTGEWMREHVLWLALGAAAALFGALLLRGLILKAIKLFMRRAPMIRDVVLAQESARFFSVMAAMTRTGVPFADALAVANQAVGHPQMRAQLEKLRTKLIGGGLLRTLLDEVKSQPLATRRLLVAADRSGDLEHAFTTLAADMTEEVEKRSARLLAMLEPLLIVVMFLIIGSLLMAIMLPMLTLSGRVGG